MKFLCDNCKAKYQIADEKVAGKTVRMKCRKCGHQIEVRAAVTETSVVDVAADARRRRRRRAAPAAKSGLATSLSAAKPRAPVGSASRRPSGALAGAFQRTVQDAPQTSPCPSASNSPVELSVTDEWYVAINGVPVGPVRISELRRKAAVGAVTEESLCWQEGLEEWRPVRSIPELAALVREAAQGNRPSLDRAGADRGSRARARRARRSAPRRRLDRRRAAAPRTPEPPRSRRSDARPRARRPPRSNVVPLRVAATRDVDERAPMHRAARRRRGRGARAVVRPAARARVRPAAQPHADAAAPARAARDRRSVRGAAARDAPHSRRRASMPPSIAAVRAARCMPQPPPKRGVPLWFWPVLALRRRVRRLARVLRLPAAAAAAARRHPDAGADRADGARGEERRPAAAAERRAGADGEHADDRRKVAHRRRRRRRRSGRRDAAEEEGLDLGGLVAGAGGPNVGGAAAARAPAAAAASTQSSVERVVAAHRAGVKRTCWERGGADQKSSVNVTVSAHGRARTEASSSTSSTGDDPVVAKCIENQVQDLDVPRPGLDHDRQHPVQVRAPVSARRELTQPAARGRPGAT